MSHKIKILSLPILLGAVFLMITGAVFYFYSPTQAITFGNADLKVDSASFSLDSSNAIHYTAIIRNTGAKESTTARNVYFYIKNGDTFEKELCPAISLPPIPAMDSLHPEGGTATVSCVSSYDPSTKYGNELKVEINSVYTGNDYGDPTGNNLASYGVTPILVSTFTQVPLYYNPVSIDPKNPLPAQNFKVNIKNTGFPLRSNVSGGFRIYNNYGVNEFFACPSDISFKDVNSLGGQTISCDNIVPHAQTAISKQYTVNFSSSVYLNVAASEMSKTIKTGAPDLKFSSAIDCGGNKVMLGSPVTCIASIKNDGGFFDGTAAFLPIAQSSLTKGLAVSANFLNATKGLIETKEVCSFVFSVDNILTLNTNGGIITKECLISSADIPTGTAYVDTTALLDPNNIVKEFGDTLTNNAPNNTLVVPQIEVTSVPFYNNVTVQLFDLDKGIVSNASGVEISFNNVNEGINESCVTANGRCSIELPAGSYEVQAKTSSALKYSETVDLQVTNRDLEMQLNVNFWTITSCSDSDSGESNPYLVQGTVLVPGGATYVDSCYGGSVKEYSCLGNAMRFVNHSCSPASCISGACAQSCATISGSADSQCKTLFEMNNFDKNLCASKDIIYEQLPSGQNCGKIGGSYCVRCKPECTNDLACTNTCLIDEEPACLSEKCGCRKKVIPDFSLGTASCYLPAAPTVFISKIAPSTSFTCKVRAYLDSVAYALPASSRPKPKVAFSIPGNPVQKGFCTTTADFSTVSASNYRDVVCTGLKVEPAIVGDTATINFYINPSKVVPETIITNNAGSKVLTIDRPVTAQPDLTVTTALSCPKTSYTIGETISGCSINISNLGGLPAVSPVTGLRYKIGLSSWTPLSSKTYSGTLGKDISAPITFDNFKFDTAGIYIVEACVDPADGTHPNGNIVESNEGNNCSGGISIEVKMPPIFSCSPAGWWCGNYADWSGSCSGNGTYQILSDKICNINGKNYCVTCGVGTPFKVVLLANGDSVANIQISLNPVDASPDFGRPVNQTNCVTNSAGTCSVVSIPGVKYSVGFRDLGLPERYNCLNCSGNTFIAKLDDAVHTLNFEQLTVVEPTISVISPNDGETFEIGKNYTLSWQASGLNSTSKLKVQICTDQSTPICVSVNGGILLPITQTTLSWTIPANIFSSFNGGISTNDRFKIRVSEILTNSSVGVLDASNNNFKIIDAIIPPAIVNCVSLYGSGWFCGTVSDKLNQCGQGKGTLNSLLTNQFCDDSASINSCVTCNITKCSVTDAQSCASFPCLINQTPQCLDGVCTCKNNVLPPEEKSITLASPIGGEVWKTGETHYIIWNKTGSISSIEIRVRNYSNGSSRVIDEGITSPKIQNYYTWTIPENFFDFGASSLWKSDDNLKIEVAESLGNSQYGLKSESKNFFKVISQSILPPPPDEPVLKDFTINLSPGINLISSPMKEFLTYEMVKKFCLVDGNYPGFIKYSSTEKKAGFFYSVSPYEGANVVIKEGSSGCQVLVKGNSFVFQSKVLKKGWNLISIGGAANTVRGDCTIEKINGYNESMEPQNYGLNDLLDKTKGYWVKVTNDCVLY